MSNTQLRMALRDSHFQVSQYPEINEHKTPTQTTLKIHWAEPVPARLLHTLLLKLPSDVMVVGRADKGIEMSWRIA
jgi:hypothetical protein